MLIIIDKIIEIFVGIFADKLGASSKSKPKLQFAITGTLPSKLTEKEARTKYSASDYSIEIYNLGLTPFILDRFTLVHKKGMLIECPVSEQDKTVSQQKNMVYTLQEQDVQTLRWFCKRDRFNKCEIRAYDLTGKCIKAKLNVSWLALQASFSAEDMIVAE